MAIPARLAAIHDLSGLGRCSLTACIPILSSMGIQVCPLPTAVLSTQTDGFEDFAFQDLTSLMRDCVRHWKALGVHFDSVYSGFLSSEHQISVVLDLVDYLRSRTADRPPLFVVDPVMGDSGTLYSTYTPEMVLGMRTLVQKSDVTTPNLTEACLLLGMPFADGAIPVDKAEYLARCISDLGPNKVVITSITSDTCTSVNVGFERDLNCSWVEPYSRVPAHYPGTGDCFTSVLTGSLLQGRSFRESVSRANTFISRAVKLTYECGTPEREGVLLEAMLPDLINPCATGDRAD